ncbi:MAG: hypothetical protein PHR06_08775 [Candidatus Cloacimonetes bacterium]|nr:hypothetical protein [Candidatus Cloacimonadota bacterium]
MNFLKRIIVVTNLLCVSALLILVSCWSRVGEEKLFSRKGDSKLTKLSKLPENYYLGISSEKSSEQEAITDATDDAIRTIIQDLGVTMEFEFITQNVESEINGHLSEIGYTEKNTKLYTKEFLQIKPESIYTEKWKRVCREKTEYFYLARIGISFSKNKYEQMLSKIISSTIDYYTRILSNTNLNSDLEIIKLISDFENITQTEKKFSENYRFSQRPEFPKFRQLSLDYSRFVSDVISSIEISNQSKNEKFLSRIELFLKFKNEPMKEFPVTVSVDDFRQILKTDKNGKLIIQINHKHKKFTNLELFAGSSLSAINNKQNLLIENFELLSPLYPSNLIIAFSTISVLPVSYFENELVKSFRTRGYQTTVLSGKYDFSIKIIQSSEEVKNNHKYSHYISEARFEIILSDRNGRIFESFSLPNEEFLELRGIGNDFRSSAYNSLDIRNYSFTKLLIDKITSDFEKKMIDTLIN